MDTKIEADQHLKNSHLFMMRLWLEELGNGQTDWRGKVQHVPSGETRYFRDWPTLEAFVEEQIHPTGSGGEPTGRKTKANIVS